MSWLRRHWIPLALFALGFAAYAAIAGDRLKRQSTDPHFVYQADAWLHGQIAIDPPPERGDDWAKVSTVELKSGDRVRGRWLVTRGFVVDEWFERNITEPSREQVGAPRLLRFFRTTDGRHVPETEIARELSKTHFVSFPPFPAVLMLPQTAIHGRIANDIFLSILVAALAMPLCFLTLRKLVAVGYSSRSVRDDLWLTICLGFGTVFFTYAAQGRVWFTAHAVAVPLALGYILASVRAERPVIAGVLLGLATLTRAPLAFMFPLFALEAWRAAGGRDNPRAVLRLWLRFAAPIVVIALVAFWYNSVRFGSPFEFGHSYLEVRQRPRIEAHGLFDYRYFARNLAVAFTLLPRLQEQFPHVQLSAHGLALWVTTPLFVLILWPRRQTPFFRALLLSAACVAVPVLFYQNSGFAQFGYRFSLDFTPFLLLAFAVSGRPLDRTARVLIAIGILINLVGAWTFMRYHALYDYSSWKVIVPH